MPIAMVYQFNRRVLGFDRPKVAKFPPGEKKWLLSALREECQEFEDAPTLVDEVDALIDTVIFALGGLYRLGLSEQQAHHCIEAVMEANSRKKAGQKASRAVDGVTDAVKPEGWVGPEARIQEIIYS